MFCYIADHPGGRSARGKVHYMTPALRFFSPWTHTWQLFYTIYVFRTCLAYYNPCSGFMSVTNHLSISFMGSTPNTRWFYIFFIRTVKSTVRRMNTPVLISFSTWVHTIFSCLWTVLLFLTWLYTSFWLYMMQKHPYFEKHSLSLQTRPVICFATIYDRMS